MATTAQKCLQCLRVCLPIALMLHVTHCTWPYIASSSPLSALFALYLSACLSLGSLCFTSWDPGPLRNIVLASGPSLVLLERCVSQSPTASTGFVMACLCPTLYALFDGVPSVAFSMQLVCAVLPCMPLGWSSPGPSDAEAGCVSDMMFGYAHACCQVFALATHLALLCKLADFRAEKQELHGRLRFFEEAVQALVALEPEAADVLATQHRHQADVWLVQRMSTLLKGLGDLHEGSQRHPTPSGTPKSAESQPHPIPCGPFQDSAGPTSDPDSVISAQIPLPSPCSSRKGSLDSSSLSDLSPSSRKHWNIGTAAQFSADDTSSSPSPGRRFARAAPTLFSPTVIAVSALNRQQRPIGVVIPQNAPTEPKARHRKATARSRSDCHLDQPRPTVRRREDDCRWLIDPSRRPRCVSYAHRETQAANLGDEWQTVLSRTRMQHGLWQWSLLLWCTGDGSFIFRAGISPADFKAVDEPIGIAEGINQHGSIRTDAINQYLEGWPTDLSFREAELLITVDMRKRRLYISRPLQSSGVSTSFRYGDVRLAVSLLGCGTHAKIISATCEE
eukprot:GGOE01041148.1.p1 GENE.GGOE01041148.1~~GGOE01041148.1.p1  ORF type:complete len:582 (+),score=120.96 GGOE01041148.1:63-1748(+)